MKKKRTPEEIAQEIAALKALIPVGQWARKTRETISLTIEALSGNIDVTADEFEEMSEEHQMDVNDALNWRDGLVEDKPSDSFDGLAEKS